MKVTLVPATFTMNPRQKSAYWVEWSRLRDSLRRRGRTDAQLQVYRRTLTRRAIGTVKPAAQFSAAEQDEVMGVMREESVAAERQPVLPGTEPAATDERARVVQRCHDACLAMADRTCGEYQLADPVTRTRYVARVCRELTGNWPENCTLEALERVAKELEARVRQLADKVQAHLQKLRVE